MKTILYLSLIIFLSSCIKKESVNLLITNTNFNLPIDTCKVENMVLREGYYYDSLTYNSSYDSATFNSICFCAFTTTPPYYNAPDGMWRINGDSVGTWNISNCNRVIINSANPDTFYIIKSIFDSLIILSSDGRLKYYFR